ncbi:SPOR domain-containing protein [Arenimonas sp.]|uniref:SPOR domain-containing protein n=1 Tax=Arenimonas sp. TaxID=1872635 RepID=UPI0039E6C10D
MAAKRSKNQARRNGGSPMPGWMWLLIGLIIGAVAIGGWLLRDRWQQNGSLLPQPDPNAKAPAATDAGVVAPPAIEKPKPKYDFYTLLPEKEVVIPDAELAEQAQAEARKQAEAQAKAQAAAAAAGDAPPVAPPAAPTAPVATTATQSDGSRYLLQAGAFRGIDEAEALKAQIALSGEIARIETAEIKGTTVYRVRMGPYASAGALAAAKQALVSHGIEGAQAIRAK